MKKQNWLKVLLVVISIIFGIVLGAFLQPKLFPSNKPSQAELGNLQLSFLKQYGTSATINEMISPKIFEVAWKGSDGSQNVSINVGGVWCEIASIPVTTTTTLAP